MVSAFRRSPRQPEARRPPVDRDHALGAQQVGAPDRELPDRAAAPDRDDVAGLDAAVLGRHVAGREDVGQEQDLLVAQAVRDLDRPDVGERHADVLRLAARVAAVEVRVAEQARAARSRRAPPPSRRSGSSCRRATSGPARQKKQPPHAIGNGTTTRSPRRRFVTPAPTSTTSPMNSWPRMSPGLHRRDEAVVEVEVGAADRGRGHADDRVARIEDRRIRDRLDADVPGPCQQTARMVRRSGRRGPPSMRPRARVAWKPRRSLRSPGAA